MNTPEKIWPKDPRFLECGCCGHLHAVEFPGSIDCRDDSYRYSLDELEAHYGQALEDVEIIEIEEAHE